MRAVSVASGYIIPSDIACSEWFYSVLLRVIRSQNKQFCQNENRKELHIFIGMLQKSARWINRQRYVRLWNLRMVLCMYLSSTYYTSDKDIWRYKALVTGSGTNCGERTQRKLAREQSRASSVLSATWMHTAHAVDIVYGLPEGSGS